MQQLLILFLAISFYGCGQRSQSIVKDASADNIVSKDNNLSFSITKATEEDFSGADIKYRDKLIRDIISLKKINGILEIPISNTNAINTNIG